jgi:poly(3-hydroxybutyrate) depolymerase
MGRCRLWMIGLLCGAGVAAQAQTLRLPAAACAELGESADGFETAWPSWPSRGSGGVAGSGVRSIAIPGFETLPAYAQRNYFWFVPESLPAGPIPLVVTLHGTAGSPVNAYNQARIVRDLWVDAARRHGFAVLSPVAGGSHGSWIAPLASGDAPTDYDVIAAAMADLESRFDIERARRYLWGFSAGGHVALDVVINPLHDGFGRRQFAAVGVNAGVLSGLACNGLDDAGCRLVLRQTFPRLPVHVLVGDADGLRTYAESDVPRFLGEGWVDARNYRYEEFAGGHWVGLDHPDRQWDWLCQFGRLLDPIQRFRLRPTVP